MYAYQTKRDNLGTEDYLDCETELCIRERNLAAQQRRSLWFHCLSFLALFGGAGLFFASWVIPPSKLQCAKALSPYSPVWDAVEFWEGDFVNFFNHTSIYRGPPSLERETAWDSLWRNPGVAIDDAGIIALNKTRPGVEFAQAYGSDPNEPTYAVSLEVFHQLHCLNLVRQATWPLEQFDKSWGELYPWDLTEPVARRMHVDHCLEALRLSFMCYGDVTPILAEVAEHRQTGIKLDFNVHHKCRNFDKIVQYVREHPVDIPDLKS